MNLIKIALVFCAITATAAATSCSARASEEYYAVRANGERDYTVNSYRKEGDTIYQVRTNGERDWQQPAVKVADTQKPQPTQKGNK
jgi:hypothetical protein